MIIVKTRENLQKVILNLRGNKAKIGFVPTMGALHAGHIELLNSGLEKQLTIVCSIFINPTQFNDKSDFENYPVTIEKDISLLEKAGCKVLFLPTVAEMYPPEDKTNVIVDLGMLGNIWEGKYRSGHFDGVCQIVDKLLKFVLPDVLFLGQKDYQQCQVIQTMVNQLKYEIKPAIVIVPTKREESGLAMSSRNKRLSDVDTQNATVIFKALNYINKHYKQSSYVDLMNEVTILLKEKGFNQIDYIAIVDAETMVEIENPNNNNQQKVAVIAAYINHIRLIDNILLT